MPKPSTVRLPGGGEIIPEHFHEGSAPRQRFDQAVRGVLSVPRAIVVEKQQAMKSQAAKARAKRQRKAG